MTDPGADRAVGAAEAYVATIDQRSHPNREAWLAAVHRNLSELYAAVVSLTSDDRESEEDEDFEDEESDVGRDRVFTHERWASLYNDLKQLLGPIDLAWEIFDPYGPADASPVQGSVADAMADVYGVAVEALHLDRVASRADAADDLVIQLEITLGHNALDAIRALHAYRFVSRDTDRGQSA